MQTIQKTAPNITSIAKNGVTSNTKKLPKNNFANFLNELGKTTKKQPSKQESTPNRAKLPQNNIPNSPIQRAIIKDDKAKAINPILKNEPPKPMQIANNNVKSNEMPNSPLQSIISKPNIENNEIKNNEIKNNENEPKQSEIKNKNEMPKNEIVKNETPKNEVKILNEPKINNEKKIENKNENIEIKNEPEKQIEVKNKNEVPKNEVVKNETKSEILKNPAQKQSEIKDENPKNIEPEKAPITPNIAPQIAQNQAPKHPQINDEKPKESPKNPQKEIPNIGLKNTLKYGAFKAFDALSLFKPSDGKKLSDLIKKADELSLNLEKIKIAQNPQEPIKPPILESKIEPTINPQPKPQQTPLNEMLNEESNQAPKNTESKMEIKNEPKTPSEIKSEKPSEKKPEIESKIEPKIESKIESKIELNKENIQKNIEPKNKESTPIPPPLSEPAQNSEEKSEIKPVSFKNEKIENSEESKQNPQKDDNKSAPKTEITQNKNSEQIQAKETIRHFSQALRQEILDYKPPLSKITLELQPANLGAVEVSITHQGKNIQIQLNASQNAINLFIQNQSELRSALNGIGYENITMSFSNGQQSAHSDTKGNWSYFRNNARNENSLEDDEKMANLEITLVNNYA